MREFKSLNPVGLHADFDEAIQTEEPIVQVEESDHRIVINYTFPGFYLSDIKHKVRRKNVKFVTPHIESTGSLMVSGKAALPSFGRYVQIPPETMFTVKVETGSPVLFEDVLLAPAQVNLSDDETQPHKLEYDQEFYSEDHLYPEKLVEVTGPQQLEEYTALLVHVHPLQYNPAKRQITGFGNITVIIDLTPVTDSPPAPYIPNDSDQRVYGNLFLNPKKRYGPTKAATDELVDEDLVVRPPSLSRLVLFNPQYLIVYYDEFHAAAKKLMQWKNDKGIVTGMVPISKITNDPETLRRYLYNWRAGLRKALRYVLLLGDADHITPHTISGGPWGSNITDYYFGANRDVNPALLTETEYVNPWLSIGRIPVRTAGEAIQVVDQIINYEKNPPGDLSYYDRMLVAAYFQDESSPLDHRDNRGYLRTMENLAVALEGLGYTVERIYTTNDPHAERYDDGTLIPASVKAQFTDEASATARLISAVTEGQLIIGHRDHGGSGGWSHPRFQIGDLAMTTGDMPSAFFSINCLTGMFDPVAECFAEANLRMQGTAPSLIAATRLSATHLNNPLETALYDALFANIIATFPGGIASYPVKNNRLGDMLNYAKMYLPVAVSGSEYYIKDHFEIYHVVGDPTLEVWVRDPVTIRMKLRLMGYRKLHIALSSVPVGTTLTVYYDGHLLRRLEPTSVNTFIALPDPSSSVIPSLRLHRVRVCCYAPGSHYVESSVIIPGFIPVPVTPVPPIPVP